jgi:hypothetical protein
MKTRAERIRWLRVELALMSLSLDGRRILARAIRLLRRR